MEMWLMVGVVGKVKVVYVVLCEVVVVGVLFVEFEEIC